MLKVLDNNYEDIFVPLKYMHRNVAVHIIQYALLACFIN